MKNTPQANRIHICIFGKCNSGKSSLVNAITGQHTAVVSDIAGTTTDPVAKSMEIKGLGACVVVDTAGLDDSGPLGSERIRRTRAWADRADVAVMVFTDEDTALEREWIGMFRERRIPILAVLNKTDLITDVVAVAESLERQTGLKPVEVASLTGQGVEKLIETLAKIGGEQGEQTTITGSLASAGDVVMLVMPQDGQAPRGRLILPQAQTIRELLDKRCVIVSCTTEGIEDALKTISGPPKLIITDSQAFGAVSRLAPEGSKLTSFSVLFARYKGDVRTFIKGAAAIDRLTENSRVLIAEACTHAPQTEDIGRVKIPRMLRARTGENLRVDVVSGPYFPEDLTPYDLVIHCGACMFNRRHVISRIESAESQGVPITNYGITIAHLTSVLDKVVYPE